MDECLDALGEAAMFSTLETSSGYYQVEVGEIDEDKTALMYHHGLNCFVQLSYAFINAPVTFQREMDVIPPPVK